MMKQNIFRMISPFILITWVILTPSCKDEWNEHYKVAATVSNERIANYVQSQPDLSKFYQMLKITGYDVILNASQTYTVWAPNNDALQNIDLNDTALVLNIVKNHITHFSFPTSGVQSEYIKMISGKKILFSHVDTGYLFGNSVLIKQGVLTANGLVHTINHYIPFQNNIWEYIAGTAGLDSLKKYVNSQNKLVFNPRLSVAIGVNSQGNTVYDSVFYKSNVLLDKLGALNAEDSIYTGILPNNTAWNEAYNRIKTFYVSNQPAIQRSYTQSSIVRDMIFRNRVSNPNSMDSLVSTTNNVFHQPGYLFSNTSVNEVSNGLVYVTSQMQYKATDSWFKEIRVEAEYSDSRFATSNENIYLRNSYGSPLNVSNKYYVLLEPTTTSGISKVYVDFNIPGTLSAKYNIYCVFVPTSIADPTDQRPCRAVFFITYKGDKLYQPLTVTNNVTDPNGITKMLIASNFTFPRCDLSLDNSIVPTVKIRVQNDVSSMETGLNRSMRIDCIILEPVVQ
jgi:uncharacterized surface protein with fasciclin (FAS1) repeats